MVQLWTILGQTVTPLRDVLVSDWWDYLRLTLHEQTDRRDRQISVWCLQFVQFEAELFKDITDSNQWPRVAGEILANAGWDGTTQQHARHILDIVSGADKYDPELAEKKCECMECRDPERKEPDPHCRFRSIYLDDGGKVEISDLSRFLAFQVRPELMAKFWDMPISVYEIAYEAECARNLGMAASRQDRKDHPERKKRDAIREEYFKRYGLPEFPGG